MGDQTFRPSVGARKDNEIAAALEKLQQLGNGRLSLNDWIELCREYVGTSAKVADLGWHHDQIDIARLMFRLQQWKPQVIVDASAGLGATLLLWTRVAQGFARLMATGFPGLNLKILRQHL